MSITKHGLKRGVALFSLVAMILPVIVIGILSVSDHKSSTLPDINHENMRLAESIRNDVSNLLQPPPHTVDAVVQHFRKATIAPRLNAQMSQMAEMLVSNGE